MHNTIQGCHFCKTVMKMIRCKHVTFQFYTNLSLLNTNRGLAVYEFLYELVFVVSSLRIRQQGSTYDTITSKGWSIARLQK